MLITNILLCNYRYYPPIPPFTMPYLILKSGKTFEYASLTASLSGNSFASRGTLTALCPGS